MEIVLFIKTVYTSLQYLPMQMSFLIMFCFCCSSGLSQVHGHFKVLIKGVSSTRGNNKVVMKRSENTGE